MIKQSNDGSLLTGFHGGNMSDNNFAVSASRAPNQDELLRQQLLQRSPVIADTPVQLPEALRSPSETENDTQKQQDLNEADKQALKEAIQQIDQLVKPLSIGLNVQRIESINRLYVKLFDRETGEILREIPPRKILEMKENIKALQGLLFDKFS
jgi:flagellar protein FlaG